MTATTFNRTIDTLASSSLDYYAGRPHDIIHKAGEKFLKAQLSRGTVKVIPATEFVITDFVKEHGTQNTAYHAIDSLAGTAFLGGGAGSLSETASDPLTTARFEVHAGTRNIVYPQAMPRGNRIDQFNLRTLTELRKIFNEEERLWWTGYQVSGTPRALGASTGDVNYVAGLPFNVEGFFSTTGLFGAVNPASANMGDWAPIVDQDNNNAGGAGVSRKVGTQADMLAELRVIQKNINTCGYSEEEHVTDGWTTQLAFEGIVDAMVSIGALPDPVRANLGNSWDYKIPFGGIDIQWSRYINEGTHYDRDDATDVVHPFYGLNMRNIHYNITTEGAMMTSEGMPGWIAQAGPLIPIVGKTNLFKRIWFSRTRSVVGGRRSSFALYRWET